jgi:mannose-6-phosphate isomerase-like protein (cupin superfamily)
MSDQPTEDANRRSARCTGFVDLGSVGVRFVASGEQTGAPFSVVEHPIPPRSLVAPMHRHSHEDEYSYVLEGRLGAQLGDEVVYAEVGELVSKPRGQWHTFWNPDRDPCRVLEIISPGGFEGFFADLAAAQSSRGFDRVQLRELGARYGVTFDTDSVPRLCTEHGLTHPVLVERRPEHMP